MNAAAFHHLLHSGDVDRPSSYLITSPNLAYCFASPHLPCVTLHHRYSSWIVVHSHTKPRSAAQARYQLLRSALGHSYRAVLHTVLSTAQICTRPFLPRSIAHSVLNCSDLHMPCYSLHLCIKLCIAAACQWNGQVSSVTTLDVMTVVNAEPRFALSTLR